MTSYFLFIKNCSSKIIIKYNNTIIIIKIHVNVVIILLSLSIFFWSTTEHLNLMDWTGHTTRNNTSTKRRFGPGNASGVQRTPSAHHINLAHG